MKKVQTRYTRTKVNKLDFDDFYDHISGDWRRKADAMQARRWRKLSREIKRSPYIDYKVKQSGGIL